MSGGQTAKLAQSPFADTVKGAMLQLPVIRL